MTTTSFATPGPDTFVWFTHRLHRDLLLERAAREGNPDWLMMKSRENFANT